MGLDSAVTGELFSGPGEQPVPPIKRDTRSPYNHYQTKRSCKELVSACTAASNLHSPAPLRRRNARFLCPKHTTRRGVRGADREPFPPLASQTPPPTHTVPPLLDFKSGFRSGLGTGIGRACGALPMARWTEVLPRGSGPAVHHVRRSTAVDWFRPSATRDELSGLSLLPRDGSHVPPPASCCQQHRQGDAHSLSRTEARRHISPYKRARSS